MNARQIVDALGGHWCGAYGVCRCPCHDDRTPSLKVSDRPERREGVDVICFAGCDWQAIKSDLCRRGLIAGEEISTPSAQVPIGERIEAQQAKNGEAARKLWHASGPITGTAGESYLRGRGIALPLPASLRFHPALKHAPTGQSFPCMVAGVQAPDRSLTGIHRTYLQPLGRAKAQVSNPKMMLGPVAGGAVRLGPAAKSLGLAEGIENALAAMQLYGGAVWATLSTTGLMRVELPELVKVVAIYADPDQPGRQAASQAAARFESEGRIVQVIEPPAGAGDWADAIAEAAA